MILSSDTQYFLLTRFNLGMYSIPQNDFFDLGICESNTSDQTHIIGGIDIMIPEHYLLRKLVFFARICVSSIFNQTDTNFTWIIMCDVKTPKFIRTILNNIVANPPLGLNIVLEFSSFGIGNIPETANLVKSYINNDTKHVVTTMLDIDDGLNNEFVSTMKHYVELFKSYDTKIVIDSNMRVIFFDDDSFSHSIHGNPIVNNLQSANDRKACNTSGGLIEPIIRDDDGNYELDTIFFTSHIKMGDYYPVIYAEELLSVYLINKYSIYSIPRGNNSGGGVYGLDEGIVGDRFTFNIDDPVLNTPIYLINSIIQLNKYNSGVIVNNNTDIIIPEIDINTLEYVSCCDDLKTQYDTIAVYQDIFNLKPKYDIIIVYQDIFNLNDINIYISMLKNDGVIAVVGCNSVDEVTLPVNMRGILLDHESGDLLLITKYELLVGPLDAQMPVPLLSIDAFFDSLLIRRDYDEHNDDDSIFHNKYINNNITADSTYDLRMPNIYIMSPVGVNGESLFYNLKNSNANLNLNDSMHFNWHTHGLDATRENYLSNFSPRTYEHEFSIDFSPFQFINHKSFYNIKENCRNPQIVTILRNPVDRFIEQYLLFRMNNELYKSGTGGEGFKHEYRLIDELLDNTDNTYIDFGIYFYHLKELYNVFGFDNVKVVLYEDFSTKSSSVRDIFKFLGMECNNNIDINPIGTSYDYLFEINANNIERIREFYRYSNNILEDMLEIKLDWNYHSIWYNYFLNDGYLGGNDGRQ